MAPNAGWSDLHRLRFGYTIRRCYSVRSGTAAQVTDTPSCFTCKGAAIDRGLVMTDLMPMSSLIQLLFSSAPC